MNLRGAVNGLIWIVCGILVIIIRTTILQTSSIFIWEALGLVMIAYGGAKLIWVLAKGNPSSPSAASSGRTKARNENSS
jgi:hypothetical protein